MNITVYHNNRCSKSRCAIELLDEKNVQYEVVEYLKDVPTKKELESLIKKLGINPEALIRKGEQDFKDHFKGKSLSDAQWIDAMLKYPKLIERPIVVKGEQAIIGRPTERILEIL